MPIKIEVKLFAIINFEKCMWKYIITGNTDTTLTPNKKSEEVQYIEIDSGVEKVLTNDPNTSGKWLSFFITHSVIRVESFQSAKNSIVGLA